MTGELLQGRNCLCNNGLINLSEKNEKTSIPGVPNTLVTLTHPYYLVTFRLKPFLSCI
jgi:hypothetical protein